MASKRASMDPMTKTSYLFQDALRKENKRSKESEDDKKIRHIANATRMVDIRAEETEEEHKSRILKQNLRQKDLRSKQTSEEVKEGQNKNAAEKVLKRALKADAYEKSFDPNADWNYKLDMDMLRHQNSRDSETEEKKLQRKKKDKEYQREKRSLESLHDKNVRKQKDVEYRYLKRIEEKEANSKKWLEIHRQRNLEPLKKHGLYFRYLLFGTPQEYHFMVNLYQLSKILNLLMIGNGLKTEPQKKYSWHRNFK